MSSAFGVSGVFGDSRGEIEKRCAGKFLDAQLQQARAAGEERPSDVLGATATTRADVHVDNGVERGE